MNRVLEGDLEVVEGPMVENMIRAGLLILMDRRPNGDPIYEVSPEAVGAGLFEAIDDEEGGIDYAITEHGRTVMLKNLGYIGDDTARTAH